MAIVSDNNLLAALTGNLPNGLNLATPVLHAPTHLAVIAPLTLGRSSKHPDHSNPAPRVLLR